MLSKLLLVLISDNKNTQQTDIQNATHKGSRSSSSSTSNINQNKKHGDTVLVVNPKSSSGSTGEGWEDLYVKIKEAFGETPEVAITKKAGDGTTIATRFLKKGFKKIVAIGGDGTINEVANGFFFLKNKEENSHIQDAVGDGDKNNNNDHNHNDSKTNYIPKPPRLELINSEAIMGLIPSGTRNVLAKSLDLPEEVMECCQNFIKGKPKKIDVICATVTDQSNHSKVSIRIFLNAAEIGIGGEIIEKAKKIREKVKSRIVSTVAILISTVPNYESNLCEFLIDDDKRREAIVTKMTMCVIANGKYLGGGFRAAPKASVSDGVLDVVILKESSNLEMIENFLKLRDDDSANEGDIFYKQAKKVSIKSNEEDDKDITVTIDGEPIGILPATFQVLQNALTVRM
jgi:YegS/Rv2252/BmrU family lipid kinase